MGTEQDPVDVGQAAAVENAKAQEEAALASANRAQERMVEEARNAGVPAFTFDPDATLEEKRAKARAVSFFPILFQPFGKWYSATTG